MRLDHEMVKTLNQMRKQRDQALSLLTLACQDLEDQIHCAQDELGGMITWSAPEWYVKAKELISKNDKQ